CVLSSVLGLALAPTFAHAASKHEKAVAYVGKFAANVAGSQEWSNTLLYVDLVKNSRAYGSPQAPWNSDYNRSMIGADGWPTSDFGIRVFDAQAGLAYRAGVYKMSFTGKVDNPSTDIVVGYVGPGKATVTNVVYNDTTKKTTADLTIPEGMNA